MAAPLPLRIPGRWLRRLLPLLGILVLLGLPLLSGHGAAAAGASLAPPPGSLGSPPASRHVVAVASAPVPAAAPPPPAWITLEGRRILEIRSAAGAQTPSFVAERGSALLRRLAADPSMAPEQLEVREDPPYAMLGLVAGGRFTPLLAVDDRAARAFDTTRQELAERYRDQLRGALRQYRSSHTVGSWLRSTALALLILGIYVAWVQLQVSLERRARHWIAAAPSPWLRGLRLAGSTVLNASQERATLLRLLRLLQQQLDWLILCYHLHRLAAQWVQQLILDMVIRQRRVS